MVRSQYLAESQMRAFEAIPYTFRARVFGGCPNRTDPTAMGSTSRGYGRVRHNSSMRSESLTGDAYLVSVGQSGVAGDGDGLGAVAGA